MKLTGKCLQDFEKWFFDQEFESIDGYFFGDYNKPTDLCMIDIFNESPPSMQYGVYVDFFDSVGFVVDYSRCYDYDVMVMINGKSYGKWLKTRHEVRTEAIKQANKIYNEKHSD